MEIRKAKVNDAYGIAKVHIDTWKTTYKGLVPDEHLSKLSYERLEQGWSNALQDLKATEVVYVIEDPEDGIIAFARAGPCENEDLDYDAELHAIYLLQQHQRKGFGTQLFFEIARRLHYHDFHSLVLWVLADNTYRQFYENLGGNVIAKKQMEIGGKSLPTVAYAWPSLEELIENE